MMFIPKVEFDIDKTTKYYVPTNLDGIFMILTFSSYEKQK